MQQEELELMSHIHHCYGYDIDLFERIDRGSADLYKIVTNKGLFVVKYNLVNHTKEKIALDIAICNHLRNNGINTPEYMPSLEGHYYTIFHERIYTISKYIHGVTLKDNMASQKQLTQSSFFYAKILDGLKDYTGSIPKFNYDIFTKESLKKTIHCLENYINIKDDNISFICKQQKNLLERCINFNLSSLYNLTVKRSHGDYTQSQFIYNEYGDIEAIVDFLSTKELPISYELFRSFINQVRSYNENTGSFEINDLVHYISVFRQYHSLSCIDISSMPLVYLVISLQNTFYLELIVANRSTQDAFNLWMKLIKQCVYISTNYEKIVRKLSTQLLC